MPLLLYQKFVFYNLYCCFQKIITMPNCKIKNIHIVFLVFLKLLSSTDGSLWALLYMASYIISQTNVTRYANAINSIPPKHKNDAIIRLSKHSISNRLFFLTFFWKINPQLTHVSALYANCFPHVGQVFITGIFFLLLFIIVSSIFINLPHYTIFQYSVTNFYSRINLGVDFCVTISYYLCVTKKGGGRNVTKDR